MSEREQSDAIKSFAAYPPWPANNVTPWHPVDAMSPGLDLQCEIRTRFKRGAQTRYGEVLVTLYADDVKGQSTHAVSDLLACKFEAAFLSLKDLVEHEMRQEANA